MKKTLITIPLVMLLLGGLGQAWALTLEFSNVGNATIYFPGDSTFNFTDSTASGSSGFDFQITGSDGNDPDTVGLYGNLSGPFTIGTITQYFPGVETAPITGTGSFSIKDENGITLTATITSFDSIFRAGGGNIINWEGNVNLSNISYTGSNTDLQSLTYGTDPILIISFTFTPAITLYQMKSGASDSTSYSGTLNVVPLPGSVLLLGTGIIGLALLGLRRRRQA